MFAKPKVKVQKTELFTVSELLIHSKSFSESFTSLLFAC